MSDGSMFLLKGKNASPNRSGFRWRIGTLIPGFVIMFVFLPILNSAHAQTSSGEETLEGTAKDTTGVGVSNAQLRIRAISTNQKCASGPDEIGFLDMPNLSHRISQLTLAPANWKVPEQLADAPQPGPALYPPKPSQPEPDSIKRLPRNIVQDQKQIWTFPFNAAHGHHWKPILGFAVATAALVELDPHDTPYFRKTKSFARFDQAFSSFNTGLAEALFPAAFYVAGLVRRDSYAQTSGILSVEAFADAEAVTEVVKNVTRRVRPIEIPTGGNFSHTWFKAGDGLLVNRGSFPSGHTTGAFAVAEVMAERYRHHKWAPWAAYGLAGVVAFSRVSNQNHFPSDVFAAAAFGYSISHFVVLRPK